MRLFDISTYGIFLDVISPARAIWSAMYCTKLGLLAIFLHVFQ